MKKKQKNLYYNNIDNVRGVGLSDISLIKKSGLDIKFCVTEIKKCIKNPIYFIENYVKIINTDVGEQPFILRDYQKEIIKAYQKQRYVIVKIGRQLGKTTLSAAYFLWMAMFKKNCSILILANNQSIAIETVDRIKVMIQCMPMWLQCGVKKWNETTIKFENGSRLKASATTASSGRGTTFNVVYIDEMAHIQENIMYKFMESVFPVISSGKKTKLFITSTPNGLNEYWRLFTEATQGVGDFFPVEFPWDVGGLRDEKFKKAVIDKHGERHFLQEYQCEFLGSAGTLLSPKLLKKMARMKPIQEKEILKTDYNLKIYKQPIEKHNYIVTVDPSEGLEQDYTSIHVIDISDKHKREQVATLRSNILSVAEAPYVLKNIAVMYNEACVVMENNKFESIIRDLYVELEYKNIVWFKGKRGIRMTSNIRNTALKQIIVELENERLLINDYDTIREFGVFVFKKGKYQADDGYHDDTVMSLSLFCYLLANKKLFNKYIYETDNYITEVYDIDSNNDMFMIFDDGKDIDDYGF